MRGVPGHAQILGSPPPSAPWWDWGGADPAHFLPPAPPQGQAEVLTSAPRIGAGIFSRGRKKETPAQGSRPRSPLWGLCLHPARPLSQGAEHPTRVTCATISLPASFPSLGTSKGNNFPTQTNPFHTPPEPPQTDPVILTEWVPCLWCFGPFPSATGVCR